MPSSIHPFERFFTDLAHFGPYPDGVKPAPQPIAGTAFFPGGAGLWNTAPGDPLPPLPVGGAMIVGHNFDSETGYAWSLAHLGENLRGPTWSNLLHLLEQIPLPPERCFFTNLYVGFKAGNAATGAFPGARDPDFVRRCRAFLAKQIRVMQPRLIATLGTYVPAGMAPLAPELSARWSDRHSLRELDDEGNALIVAVRFAGLAEPCAVVALTHPAYRRLNVHTRHYQSETGHDAEVALLRAALAHLGGV